MNQGSCLRHANVEVTGWCNQRCAYCFNNSSATRTVLEPDLEWWTVFLRTAKAHGLESIHVTGGEPFSWSGIVEFIRRCQQEDLVTSVLSNGMNVARFCAEEPTTMRGLSVAQVSLDSLEPRVMARRRGTPSALRDALTAITALRGLDVRVEVSTVMDSETAAGYESLSRFAEDVGASIVLRAREQSGRRGLPASRCTDLGTPGEVKKVANSARGVEDRFFYLPSTRERGCSQGIRTVEVDGRFSPLPVVVRTIPTFTIWEYIRVAA